ncbi:hypothetical protein HR51_27780 [Burkholderia cepacia]|nr:hypothetical protein HR51_27780 [Burkholderia cepacia]
METRFEYDLLGRRLVKTDTSFDVRGMKQRTETKRFVWEGLRLAQEIRETGVSGYFYSPDAPYTPAARVDTVIAEALAVVAIDTAKRTARIYHFHTDLVGAPLEVADESGELAWAGKYTAWGRHSASSRSGLLSVHDRLKEADSASRHPIHRRAAPASRQVERKPAAARARADAAGAAAPRDASYHMARPCAMPDGPRPFPFTCCTLRRHS